MYNLILENLNLITIMVFVSIILFCLVQYYYYRNIGYFYIALGSIVGLIAYLYLKNEIINYIFLNKNNRLVIDNKIIINNKYHSVMNILNINYLLHVLIIYLIFCLLIIILSNKVIKNNWELIIIKNILGEKIQKIILKGLKYSGKSNDFFIGLGYIFILISIIASTYSSYFILNNIELISEIIINK